MLIASRMLLEKSFEAVLDAGYNLEKIRGKNIAVVCGLWKDSTRNDPAHEIIIENYDANFNANDFMCANRISNCLDLTVSGTLQQTIKSCLETLNIFMKQSSHAILSSVVIAEKQDIEDVDIASMVANVLGIKDLKTVNQSWTLPELGMDSILALEVRQIMESQLDVITSWEDPQTMSVGKLQQMVEDKQNPKKTGKKITTQSQLIMEKALQNKPFCRIPFDENSNEKFIDFDEYPTIFMFPGVEGLAVTMQSLARNLPGQVICFQYYFSEMENFSLNKLCNYFAKYILENFNFEKEFCLIGHSLGGALALHVADILEKQGKRENLYIIDSSLSYFRELQNTKMVKQNYSTEEQIEIKVCSIVVSAFLPTLPLEKLTKSIQNLDSWESKKTACLSLLSTGLTNENGMSLSSLFDNIYKIIKATLDHQFSGVLLESSCILIRCAENPHHTDDDYGLSECFKNPIQIYKVDADHFKILHHPKTSEIISKSPLWKK